MTAGTAAINGRTAGATLPAGATITSGWNADRSGNSDTVTFTNVGFNGNVAGRTVGGVRLPGTGTSTTCSAS